MQKTGPRGPHLRKHDCWRSYHLYVCYKCISTILPISWVASHLQMDRFPF